MDTKFLRELIENNTRVILPEFGAFLVKDDGTGVFKPESLTFSPFLRYNDGVVEDALAITKKISKDQAKAEINKFIEEAKNVLLEKKSFNIEGLGTLYVDNRGSIHFTSGEPKISESQSVRNDVIDIKKEKPKTVKTPPSPIKVVEEVKKAEPEPKKEVEITETKPSSIDIKKETEIAKGEQKNIAIKKEEEKEKEKAEQKLKQEEKEAFPSQPKEADIIKDTPKKLVEIPVAKAIPPKPSTTKMEKPKKKSGSGTGKAILMGTLIGLGIVILVAGGWYLYDTGFFDSGQGIPEDLKVSKTDVSKDQVKASSETEKQTSEPKGKFDDEFAKLSSEIDKSADETDPSITTKTTDKRLVKPKPTGDEKLAVSYPQDGMFHIIVGSFRNANYAEKFSEDMKVSGFKSRVIVQPSGMHSVTLGSFLTRQEAVDSMDQWKQQHPNIWILKQ